MESEDSNLGSSALKFGSKVWAVNHYAVDETEFHFILGFLFLPWFLTFDWSQ